MLLVFNAEIEKVVTAMRKLRRYLLTTLALGVLSTPIVEAFGQGSQKPVSLLSSRHKKKKPVRKLSAKSGRKYAAPRKIKTIKLASKKTNVKKSVKKNVAKKFTKKSVVKKNKTKTYKKKNLAAHRYK